MKISFIKKKVSSYGNKTIVKMWYKVNWDPWPNHFVEHDKDEIFTAVGVCTCDKDDTFNNKIGRKIAETKAQMKARVFVVRTIKALKARIKEMAKISSACVSHLTWHQELDNKELVRMTACEYNQLKIE